MEVLREYSDAEGEPGQGRKKVRGVARVHRHIQGEYRRKSKKITLSPPPPSSHPLTSLSNSFHLSNRKKEKRREREGETKKKISMIRIIITVGGHSKV